VPSKAFALLDRRRRAVHLAVSVGSLCGVHTRLNGVDPCRILRCRLAGGHRSLVLASTIGRAGAGRRRSRRHTASQIDQSKPRDDPEHVFGAFAEAPGETEQARPLRDVISIPGSSVIPFPSRRDRVGRMASPRSRQDSGARRQALRDGRAEEWTLAQGAPDLSIQASSPGWP